MERPIHDPPRHDARTHDEPHGDAAREDAREAARDAGAAARAQAFAVTHEQKRAAAEQMSGLAQALRSTAGELERSSSAALAPFLERAASGIDSASRTLHDEDVRTLVGRVENFARQQPGAFLGGSVALGFGLARFLKSSATRRPDPAEGRSVEDERATRPIPENPPPSPGEMRGL